MLYLDEGLTEPDRHGFSVGVIALQPRSTGSVTLRSSDPLDPPEIDYALFTDPDDMRVVVEGIRQMRQIAATPPLSDIVEEERMPGADADVESSVRANAQTVYHPVGTCSFGKVVDNELRVRGLEGVRVADASVIPNLMRGHPHAQVSMLALRAAELIKRTRLPEPSSA